MKKKIFIFGGTGSIGTSTIDIIVSNHKSLELVGFTYYNNEKKADEISAKFPNAKKNKVFR